VAADNLKIDATVLKFGSIVADAEALATFVESGELVAHSTAEFIF